MSDTLEKLKEAGATEDRTVFLRESPGGIPREDFEIVERTDFSKAFPETTTEYRAKRPLACGHNVNKENPVGGLCQSQNFLGKPCREEMCQACRIECSACGKFISRHCCTRVVNEKLVCKRCAFRLRTKKTIAAAFQLLIGPFKDEDEK